MASASVSVNLSDTLPSSSSKSCTLIIAKISKVTLVLKVTGYLIQSSLLGLSFLHKSGDIKFIVNISRNLEKKKAIIIKFTFQKIVDNNELQTKQRSLPFIGNLPQNCFLPVLPTHPTHGGRASLSNHQGIGL